MSCIVWWATKDFWFILEYMTGSWGCHEDDEPTFVWPVIGRGVEAATAPLVSVWWGAGTSPPFSCRVGGEGRNCKKKDGWKGRRTQNVLFGFLKYIFVAFSPLLSRLNGWERQEMTGEQVGKNGSESDHLSSLSHHDCIILRKRWIYFCTLTTTSHCVKVSVLQCCSMKID